MTPFKQIAVLMGGPSAEREVSLRSGSAVANGLRACGYTVQEIDVRTAQLELPAGVEAVFIALHGTFGEDGEIQEMLRERHIPFTGAKAESSRLAFDKRASKEQFLAHALPTPPYEILRDANQRTLSLPLVVKPLRQGSSIGIHRVFRISEWSPAFSDALAYDGEVLVETYISGRELTVGIVDDTVLPVLEIRAPDGYYDYRAKYTTGLTEYLVPAPMPMDAAQRCQDLALQAFHALGGYAFGRVDFRMTESGELFILEVNTIPGFTETSLLPKSAAAAGIGFPELCDRIMRLARVH